LKTDVKKLLPKLTLVFGVDLLTVGHLPQSIAKNPSHKIEYTELLTTATIYASSISYTCVLVFFDKI